MTHTLVPLIISSFLTGPAAAHAAAYTTQAPDAGSGDGCNPNRPNDYPDSFLYDGWVSYPGGPTVGGVYSNIYNYSPWVHYISSTKSVVVAFTMIDDINSQYDWAQIGWLEYPQGVRHTFDQTSDSAGNLRTELFSPQAVNTSTYYTTLYNNPSGKFGFQVNGKTIDSTPIVFTPNEGQNSGEAKSTADQMPGGYQNPETFGDTHIYYNGGWHAYSGSTVMTKPFYGGLKIDDYNLQIWDNACRT